MLDEVKKLAEYFKKDKGIRSLRNRLLLIFLIFAVLLLANRFFLINLADKGEFYLSITRTKIVFWGSTSVYNTEINPAASELAKMGIENLGKNAGFNLPLFALIFYLPFIYIKDIDWSFALWMTTNQILCFFILNNLLQIMNWKIKETYRYISIVVVLLVYFIIGNVFHANLAIIQILLITLAYKKILDREYIFSGILLGLAFFNPYQLFIPLMMIVVLNIHKQRGTINVWLVISFLLFSMLFVIFDMRWMLELLKSLVLQPTVYPFISYRNYLAGIFPAFNTSFAEVIPVVIFFWVVIEYLRTPKEHFFQELWLICLAMTLNPLLNMWDSTYSTAAYLVVFIYTLSLWYDRSTIKFRIFSAILYGVLLIGAPIVQMVINKGILPMSATYVFNLLTTLVLLLNLYWVRLWVVNPYYAINKIDEI